eukprot:TRINITY_DN6500_c0_g1_i1.p1 TRINITY_DN6500_c0_g1~~TRINITY_DN6500_c0_g1_i1.p1  ORF type:complete len:1131 (-),score=199.26 TRINITY_DN6500_c0_g1_i1:187-3579(-)
MNRTKKGNTSKISLERVVGTTSRHNSNLAFNPTTGEIAHTAGSVVVLFDPKTSQHRYFFPPKPKSIVCLDFSSNGKYLAAGEAGYQPAILVWDLASGKLLVELQQHQFGVACIKFDPSCKWLVSVGFKDDKFIHVWDWKEKVVVATNKVSNKIYAIDFSEDGTHFVTSGVKHLKFWYHVDNQGVIRQSERTYKGRSVLEGKSVLLGDKHKACTFMDVRYAKGPKGKSLFTVTQDGYLIQIEPGTRKIEKWVHMKTPMAFGLSLSDQFISVACDSGLTRLFSPNNLQYITTLPKPPSLGCENPKPEDRFLSQPKVYADVIGTRISEDESLVTCLYGNRNIFVWNIQDTSEINLFASFPCHGACIWDAVVSSNGRLVTASADNTVRVWNLEGDEPTTDMEHCISVAENAADLKLDSNVGGENIFVGDGGIRCAAFSPDEGHLAFGDRNGNLHIYDTRDFKQLASFPAHEGEVMTLDYSSPANGCHSLLATGSRDRLIHIFERDDGERNSYSLVNTLNDHTSTVTSVRFSEDMENDKTRLISCSTDKTILFRNIEYSSEREISAPIYHRDICAAALYDIQLEPTELTLMGVGVEPKLFTWDVRDGKKSKTVPFSDLETNKANRHLKVSVDPSGLFAVTSSQDRYIRLYDLTQGTLIARVAAHSELITGVTFTPCCSFLVSVGGDGCIFVWKLATEITQAMKKQREQIIHSIPRAVALQSWPGPQPSTIGDSPLKNNSTSFLLDGTNIPLWAKKRCSDLDTVKLSGDKDHRDDQRPTNTRVNDCWLKQRSNIDVYATLIDRSQLLSVNKFSELHIPVCKKSSGTGTGVVLGVMEFNIDDQSDKAIPDDTTQEDDAIDPNDTTDDVFVSVEDSPHNDFLMEDFESYQSKLPAPKNPSRLSLSAQFHEGLIPKMVKIPTNSVGTIIDGETSQKRAKWEQDVERSRQRLIELGIYKADSSHKHESTQNLDQAPESEADQSTEGEAGDVSEELEEAGYSEVSAEEEEPLDIDSFILQFRTMFDQTLSLYWSLKTSAEEAPEPSSSLQQIETLFKHMQGSLDMAVPRPDPHPAIQQLLNSYSDKLVALVNSKTQPATTEKTVVTKEQNMVTEEENEADIEMEEKKEQKTEGQVVPSKRD